jgi:two-component system, sensor histidine kinase
MIFKSIVTSWRDLSVSKKLYAVVGLMTFLITAELFTLKYTVNILSAVRAFVSGEGLWSKAQKNALLEIQNYILFRDEKYHKAFLEHLAVPMGDREARLELMKEKPDLKIVYNGFLKGRNHPNDIEGMIHLITNYKDISYLAQAIDAWTKADSVIDEILKIENEIHEEIQRTPKDQVLLRQQEFLQRITDLNLQVTLLADRFTYSLGEASRWVEGTLFLVLLIIILSVETTGLLLTFKFSQKLVRSLNELNYTAKNIGTGDFSQEAPVHSKDELGQLAVAFNQMAQNLNELAGEKNQAEKSNQVKSLFLANMSHEIRTPLGAILGFIDLLKEPHLSEKKRSQYLDIISRTGASLATIINDILDLSKVEANKIEVNLEVFSLKQLMHDLNLLLELRSEAKGIDLSFEAGEETPEFIYSDPMRLRQILVNIIGNAIKFTTRGSVRVRYEIKNERLNFYVQDTGMGVSPHEQEKLFVPFSQGDLSIRKNFGGTGLGLVLSRKLAQLLGGNVSLFQTKMGLGSTFLVEVKYEIPEEFKNITHLEKPAAEEFLHEQNSLDGCRVLLVEDTVENQIFITHMLEKNNIFVRVADDGQAALDILTRENFDLVLMDMQMPVLDGYTTTAVLRERGYTKPIISLTAHAMREDLKKCLDAGCNEAITKPVRQATLINILKKHYSAPKSQQNKHAA